MISISRQEIEQAAAGDMKAFRAIYDKTCDFVYGVALRMTASHQEAEEITQDVFMKVYKGLKYFAHRSSLKTWIYRIAVNTTLSRFKRRFWPKTLSLDSLAEHHLKSKASEVFDLEADQRIIKKMLSCLNPNQRLCIILRHAEQMSYEEIAQALKININTVRTHLRRARKKLLLLRKEGPTYEM